MSATGKKEINKTVKRHLKLKMVFAPRRMCGKWYTLQAHSLNLNGEETRSAPPWRGRDRRGEEEEGGAV